jgi:hypothetical protein
MMKSGESCPHEDRNDEKRKKCPHRGFMRKENDAKGKSCTIKEFMMHKNRVNSSKW